MNRRLMFGPALAGLCLVLLAVLAFRWPLLAWPIARPLGFVVAASLLILELGAIGVCISGRATGVIIDARNCMSLSKLQACAWTVMVLAALLVAASFNLLGWGARTLSEHHHPERPAGGDGHLGGVDGGDAGDTEP